MDQITKVKWSTFLKDVMMCSLGSYGGPEAHYGVFSSILVEKRHYLSEEELGEMIGLYALVPGPSSTQTITAIGYYVGGPILALLTFLVWAFPAIIIMTLFGVFFSFVAGNETWKPILTYLPAAAVGFIVYAAIKLSLKVIKRKYDLILYGVMIALSFFLVPYSMWVVPLLLVTGGVIYLLPHLNEKSSLKIEKPRWMILLIVVFLALLNEGLILLFESDWLILYTSFYRYGYSVIGGGQIVVPLMIQDLVVSQSLISLNDFLAGYAIDQAIPGPLFSFASFVSARSFAGTNLSFLAGLVGGLSIFLPGTLLLFFIFPLWKKSRLIPQVKYFLIGVSVTAASLLVMTGINQSNALSGNILNYVVVLGSALLLFSKKIPAPFIIVLVALMGMFL